MIQTITGDMLKYSKGYLVHGCNAQGVMGSGIAKQIREQYPLAYQEYKNMQGLQGQLQVGTNSYAYYGEDEKIIVNAVTQHAYGNDKNIVYVDYVALSTCFKKLSDFVMNSSLMNGIPKIVNFPLIGCGLANGDWRVVSELIDDALDDSIDKVLWVLE